MTRALSVLVASLPASAVAGGSAAAWPEHPLPHALADYAGAAVGDLDQDGDADLVVTSSSTSFGPFGTPAFFGFVEWFANDGAGGLGAALGAVDPGGRIGPVHTVDIDGDGRLDILYTVLPPVYFPYLSVWWMENQGTGFGSPRPIVATGAPESVLPVDLDGDADPDLLAGSPLRWYENQGGGSFALAFEAPEPDVNASSFDVADVDGDGDPDFVHAGGGGANPGVFWTENAGGGAFGATSALDVVPDRAVRPADVDGDGHPDVLTYHSDDGVRWYRNLAGTAFAAAAPLVDASTLPLLEDVDGDGTGDLVARDLGVCTLAWFPGSGSGLFGASRALTDVCAYTTVTADLDGDGDVDVVGGDSAGPGAWFENPLVAPPADSGDPGTTGGTGSAGGDVGGDTADSGGARTGPPTEDDATASDGGCGCRSPSGAPALTWAVVAMLALAQRGRAPLGRPSQTKDFVREAGPHGSRRWPPCP